MPTAALHTYTGDVLTPAMKPEEAKEICVKLATGTYAKGTVVGEVTATPGTFKAYASGNSDGSEVPRGLLKRACAVDGSGNITYGTATGGTEFGLVRTYTDIWISGAFFTQDLVGLDANAVTKLGRLAQGTTTTGILQLI